MANQKITELAAITPTTDDALAVVDDPGGTPVSKKLLISQLISSLGLSNVTIQTLNAGTTTYTPTSGMKKVLLILVGGGGGGQNVTAADDASGGGGGGGTVIYLATAAQIGASDPCVIGTGGSAAGAGNSTTMVDLSLTAGGGGTGAATGNTTTVGVSAAGGTGGTATGGNLNIPGMPGGRGMIYSTADGKGGYGGDSVFGHGAAETATAGSAIAGSAYGGGGSGAHTLDDTNRSGGAGADGVIYAIEFIA
jgi:hypothetical protein